MSVALKRMEGTELGLGVGHGHWRAGRHGSVFDVVDYYWRSLWLVSFCFWAEKAQSDLCIRTSNPDALWRINQEVQNRSRRAIRDHCTGPGRSGRRWTTVFTWGLVVCLVHVGESMRLVDGMGLGKRQKLWVIPVSPQKLQTSQIFTSISIHFFYLPSSSCSDMIWTLGDEQSICKELKVNRKSFYDYLIQLRHPAHSHALCAGLSALLLCGCSYSAGWNKCFYHLFLWKSMLYLLFTYFTLILH